MNAPSIPETLAKLLNSFDKKWGRNGNDWMGAHREHSGGTTLDRARELHAKWHYLKNYPDLPFDKTTIEFLEQNYIKVWKDHA